MLLDAQQTIAEFLITLFTHTVSLLQKQLVHHFRALRGYRADVLDVVIHRLRAAVKASGLKQSYIARVAGMDESKLSKILRGHQEPGLGALMAIAHAINVDPGRLFSEEELVIALDALRTAHSAAKTVESILASHLPEPEAAVAPMSMMLRKPAPRRRALPIRAAANPNAELVVELETKRRTIPRRAWNRGARIIARAIGDSMDGGSDPIVNGELVYVKPKRNPRTANNEVVLCRVGDGIFLKKLELVGQNVRLLSTNADAWKLDEAEIASMKIIGIAVDHGLMR